MRTLIFAAVALHVGMGVAAAQGLPQGLALAPPGASWIAAQVAVEPVARDNMAGTGRAARRKWDASASTPDPIHGAAVLRPAPGRHDRDPDG